MSSYLESADHDMLICGLCQAEFPLGDIVKFIHHKAQQCNKENVKPVGCCNDTTKEDEEDGNDMQDGLSHIENRQPSISAPIANFRASPDTREQASPKPAGLQNIPMNLSMDDSFSGKGRTTIEKPKQKDADTNTSNTEPCNFICLTCKDTLDSAWSLVQHVQNAHGMKIYADNSPTSTTTSSTSSFMPKLTRRSSCTTASTTTTSIPPTKPSPSHDKPSQLFATSVENVAHPPHPFLFRMPLGERQPLSSMNHGPFNRPPGPDFRVELLHDPFHRMSGGIGFPPQLEPPTGAFHSPFDRPRPLGIGIEPSLDFYSQRLRRLAGTNGMPGPAVSPSHSAESPGRKQMTNYAPNSSSAPTTPTQAGGGDVDTSKNGTPKLKACEFCGKCFRFQSNLIVHRRSHTGEKPFKCSLCPHACTQASKLKRHMKTHMNKSPFSAISHGSSTLSDGSLASTSSTPDSNRLNSKNDDSVEHDGEDDSDDDVDEDEKEMEVDNFDVNQNEEPTDLSSRKQHHHIVSLCDEYANHHHDSDYTTSLKKRQTLLSEVMERTGLNSIQQYSEAFQQALAENSLHNESKGMPGIKMENGPTSAEKAPETADAKVTSTLLNGSPRFEYPHEFVNRVKHEPISDNVMNMGEAMYSHIWFPPSAASHDLFLGAPRPSLDMIHQNGALALDVSMKTSSSSSSTTSSPQQGVTRTKENRRNDTCEYCGKIFKNCSNLTVHRRSHTGEKPYKCGLCSYACAQSSKLTRHMKTHGRLGKDVYRCKFCNMPFSVPSTLEKHMRKCVESQALKILASEHAEPALGNAHVAIPDTMSANTEMNRSIDSHHSDSMMSRPDSVNSTGADSVNSSNVPDSGRSDMAEAFGRPDSTMLDSGRLDAMHMSRRDMLSPDMMRPDMLSFSKHDSLSIAKTESLSMATADSLSMGMNNPDSLSLKSSLLSNSV
ncbi:BCL11 transcription factor A-like isoform X2 [Tubulanus polymorphus]|uniref:BCL11 transcription factor A-like isoform X2 n=1 Tax=Tubulanus polymorphus TaxID=672921 RepID=UPI003DA39C5E